MVIVRDNITRLVFRQALNRGSDLSLNTRIMRQTHFFCCFLLLLFRSGTPGVSVAVVMERVEAAEDDVVEQVA